MQTVVHRIETIACVLYTFRLYLLWRCIRDSTLEKLPRRHTVARFTGVTMGSGLAVKRILKGFSSVPAIGGSLVYPSIAHVLCFIPGDLHTYDSWRWAGLASKHISKALSCVLAIGICFMYPSRASLLCLLSRVTCLARLAFICGYRIASFICSSEICTARLVIVTMVSGQPASAS